MENTDATQSNTPTLSMRTLPPGIAELSAFHGPLPSWYRYDVGSREPEMTPRRAFEMLVSAACYLAIQADPAKPSSGTAYSLLRQCASGLRDEVAEMRSAPEEMEALIQQDKQIRWRRYYQMHSPPQEPPRQTEGVLRRWMHRWRGVPTVVAL